MNRKILFACFLLSLVGFGFGLIEMSNTHRFDIPDFLKVWFVMSIPLIVYYGYFKIVKGGK